MAVTVTSGSLSSVPISDYHQRTLDTDNEGTLWLSYRGATYLEFAYSTDNGTTWTDYGGSTISGVDERSIFIDADNVIHLVYLSSGTMTYRKISISYSGGVPTLTYGVSYSPSGNTWSYPHVVVHQHGTDKKIHIGYHSSIGNGRYTRLNLSSSDTVTEDTHNTSTGISVGRGDIDFYHTGDGLTVKDSTPHVFFSGGNGNTMQFVKLSYSGGVWSFGTVRSIYTSNESTAYASLAFDGTRVIMSGFDTLGAVRVFQRDAADTTTTDLSPSSMTLSGSASRVGCGYDADNGDIYLGMVDNTSLDPYYASYDRVGGTWTSKTQVEATTVLGGAGRFTVLRHSRISRIGMSYARDLATDDIRYHEIAVLNAQPTATIVSPTNGEVRDTSSELLIDWDFSDADGDTQTHFTLKRVIDALTTEYWNGTSWDSSESASTKISSTASAVTLPKNWGDPSTETIHTYSVKVWDSAGLEGVFSSSIDVYPFSNDSTNRGLSLPRPFKKQENLLATLKSNNDYMLSWVNNYVPSYGDLNDDLYTRAGLRPGSTSTMRSMFPPSVGVFSVGNGTNYFQDLGATNVYRTNELALSSERAKRFYERKLQDALGIVLSVPVETFAYNDERRNYDSEYRLGLTLEDVKHTINELNLRYDESAFVIKDRDGNEYLNTEQLVYVLWQAVQELYDIADPSGRRKINSLKRSAPRDRLPFKRKKNNQK